jgi:hypothetical protein
MKTIPFLRIFLIGLTALLALAPQAPIFAGTWVDPATLNPPPPPEFNPSCAAAGFGTLCHLQFSDPPLVNDPFDLDCSTFTLHLLVSQTRSVEGRRYYDHNNNLKQRHYREVLAGTFVNPTNHATLRFSQDDTVVDNLAVPGDDSSGILTVTGLLRVYLPTGSTVLIDAGKTINTADGALIREMGPHPFTDYFVNGDVAAFKPLCDALK